MGLDPDHAPEAIHSLVLVDSQEIVTAEFTKAMEDEEVMISVAESSVCLVAASGTAISTASNPPPPQAVSAAKTVVNTATETMTTN